jgi:hypothetical protein
MLGSRGEKYAYGMRLLVLRVEGQQIAKDGSGGIK